MNTQPTNNALYVRRRAKVLLPTASGEAAAPNVAASAAKNVEALGYTFTPALLEACQALPQDALVTFYEELVSALKMLRGAQQEFKPFYPNFPQQVMEMHPARLYLNALLHYWTEGRFRRPSGEAKERPGLADETILSPLDLGTREDFEGLVAQMVGGNTAFSEQDRADVAWFVSAYGDAVEPLLPDAIPQKENVAALGALLTKSVTPARATDFVARYVKTATDVLRFAVALSDGDVSLATPGKFRTFSRSERRLLLGLVERQKNPTEDMLRFRARWIRLGEKLHPGEFARTFPKTAEAFAVLRDDKPFATFNGQVESALVRHDVVGAVKRLQTRPGDLARRLDHVLRSNGDADAREQVLRTWEEVAREVSTPVLLQVRQHFLVRNDTSGLRVFFPKGNVARAQAIPNTLPPLPNDDCQQIAMVCDNALRARFGGLPPLGTVYVDPMLRDFPVPFALRSASKALRTLVRGSRLPLGEGDTIRFFIWWKNGKERTDIDLSAALYDGAFEYRDVLSYYNLKNFGGVHSGDIVDAPDGASEFIDVSLSKLREAGLRYIVMSVNSYTRQSFVELPECFAGWMIRQEPGSGEIYEPKTVQDRLDLTADTKIAIPLVIDVEERQVIWCDMALRRHPQWQNNVAGNVSGIGITLQALTDLKKPQLYDLFRLHGEARGTLVDTPESAETVFSVANGTPFRIEEIASQYLG